MAWVHLIEIGDWQIRIYPKALGHTRPDDRMEAPCRHPLRRHDNGERDYESSTGKTDRHKGANHRRPTTSEKDTNERYRAGSRDRIAASQCDYRQIAA